MYYETKQGDDELCRLFDEDNEEKKPRKRRRNEASILEQENDIDRLSNNRPKRAAAIRQTETSSSGQRRIDEFLANKRSPKKNNPKNLNVNSILPPASVSENERCPICDRLMSIDILETHTQTCIIRNTAAAKELIEKSKLRAKMEAVAKETLFGRKIRDITRARRGEAAPHDSQNSSKSKFIFAPPSENISDILFPQRSSTSEILVTPRRTTPRKRPNVNLIRLDSETTTCPTCGMQMTVTRLENQHKKTCSKSLISS